MTCPGRDRSAAYHADRERALVSLVGTPSYRRAYYCCRRCGSGLAPFDQQAAVTARALTPAAERLAALAGGVCHGFQGAADLLREMSSLRPSGSAAERATEDAGARIERCLRAGSPFGPAAERGWYRGAEGRGVAHLTLDATGTRQRGPDGKAAEGRVAHVCGICNPYPDEWLRPPGKPPPRLRARRLSGPYPLGQSGPLTRRRAAGAGTEKAGLWVALTDGGNGPEEFVRMNFDRAGLVLILDFWHAAGYLEELARTPRPRDEGPAKDQARRRRGLLKQGGGAATLAALGDWRWPERQPPALREQRGKVRGYFQNNPHRMEHPEYLAGGWQIGSGVVGSACKTVVGQRLKGPVGLLLETSVHKKIAYPATNVTPTPSAVAQRLNQNSPQVVRTNIPQEPP